MSQQGETQVPFSKRSACSETDPSFQNFNHNMMDFGYDEKLGRNIPRLVRGAAKVKVEFEYKPEELNSVQVHVIVRNTSAGHNFPTDSPLRHLILVVDARDQFMNVLPQVDGPQIPNWGGVYNAFMDASGVKPYAGLPGTIFANLLVEEDINLWPSAAYWNETKPASIKKNKVLSDNRLKPGGKDVSDYFFSVADDGEIRLTVSLIYRFAFYDLMLQKRWADSQERRDIPVTVVQCTGNVRQLDQIDCHQIDP